MLDELNMQEVQGMRLKGIMAFVLELFAELHRGVFGSRLEPLIEDEKYVLKYGDFCTGLNLVRPFGDSAEILDALSSGCTGAIYSSQVYAYYDLDGVDKGLRLMFNGGKYIFYQEGLMLQINNYLEALLRVRVEECVQLAVVLKAQIVALLAHEIRHELQIRKHKIHYWTVAEMFKKGFSFVIPRKAIEEQLVGQNEYLSKKFNNKTMLKRQMRKEEDALCIEMMAREIYIRTWAYKNVVEVIRGRKVKRLFV